MSPPAPTSPADYSVNGPLSWPTEFYTKGLVTYWNVVNYPQKLWNSTLIAGSVAVLAVVISLFNVYAIGIGRVKGRLWIVALFLLGSMLRRGAARRGAARAAAGGAGGAADSAPALRVVDSAPVCMTGRQHMVAPST